MAIISITQYLDWKSETQAHSTYVHPETNALANTITVDKQQILWIFIIPLRTCNMRCVLCFYFKHLFQFHEFESKKEKYFIKIALILQNIRMFGVSSVKRFPHKKIFIRYRNCMLLWSWGCIPKRFFWNIVKENNKNSGQREKTECERNVAKVSFHHQRWFLTMFFAFVCVCYSVEEVKS